MKPCFYFTEFIEYVLDIILDGEHIKEDFGELYQEEDIQKLELEEQVIFLEIMLKSNAFHHVTKEST